MRLPAPAALNGRQLLNELAATGATSVILVADEIEIDGASNRTDVERIVTAHKPQPTQAEPSLADRLAAVEERLDKAANAAVTGEAAKLRDNLKPAT